MSICASYIRLNLNEFPAAINLAACQLQEHQQHASCSISSSAPINGWAKCAACTLLQLWPCCNMHKGFAVRQRESKQTCQSGLTVTPSSSCTSLSLCCSSLGVPSMPYKYATTSGLKTQHASGMRVCLSQHLTLSGGPDSDRLKGCHCMGWQ